MAKQSGKQKLRGYIYQKRGRYYWKVQLPGETKLKRRPRIPVGAKYATTDESVAYEVASAMEEGVVIAG